MTHVLIGLGPVPDFGLEFDAVLDPVPDFGLEFDSVPESVLDSVPDAVLDSALGVAQGFGFVLS